MHDLYGRKIETAPEPEDCHWECEDCGELIETENSDAPEPCECGCDEWSEINAAEVAADAKDWDQS